MSATPMSIGGKEAVENVSFKMGMIEKTNALAFDGNTLYVGGSGPGNYSSIQDAVDNATDGDTVYVFDDSSPYHENVVIGKSISLIGEDKYTTVINGRIKIHEADGVTISGFTINKGQVAIEIWYSSNHKIIGNSITDTSWAGIELWFSDNVIIMDNTITDNTGEIFHGIFLHGRFNNTISGNIIANNSASRKSKGIYLDGSVNGTITGNTITNNTGGDGDFEGSIGIDMSLSSNNTISNNIITDNNGGPFYMVCGQGA